MNPDTTAQAIDQLLRVVALAWIQGLVITTCLTLGALVVLIVVRWTK